jgi:hypothetical protein
MEKPIYFRRCHVCATLNHLEDSSYIERCAQCAKPIARFHFFDDRFTPIQSDRTLRTPPLEGEYPPLQGLSVYWETF